MSERRPQPVNWASRITAAVAILAGLVPTVGRAFEWLSWNATQVDAYILAANGILAAVAIILGLDATRKVTPVADPRDDGLAPLVPVADDYLDD